MLIVHYEELKNFDKFSNTWKGKDDKKQADTLGHLLMAIGVNEITEKTVDEIIFRTKFLDFCWGSSFFVGNPSDTDLRQLFKNHIGLRIEITNRGLKNISTRHKFMVNQLQTIEERIMKQINN
tara:strand:- start:110 stop:478 length:369 start_codon:yes stop_codon:yes gene_type:complete